MLEKEKSLKQQTKFDSTIHIDKYNLALICPAKIY